MAQILQSDEIRSAIPKKLSVSALICTRNRSEMLPYAVESILKGSSIIHELIVIDQSTDERSKMSLTPYFFDSRLVYVPDDRVGKSLALNKGLLEAKGDVVAMTDDDCIVSQSWPDELILPFRNIDNLAISCGNVVATIHDINKEFIPEYNIDKDRIIANIRQMKNSLGIGANMAVSKSKVLSIGGYDESLGPGAKFMAGEDYDIIIRCLLNKMLVYQAAKSEVIHYGIRTIEESRYLIQNAYFGMGATYIKPIKIGKLCFLHNYMYELFINLLGNSIKKIIFNNKPYGIARILNFVKGSVKGIYTFIDNESFKYC